MISIYEGLAITTIALSSILALLLLIKFLKLSTLLKVVGIYIIVGASIDVVSFALYKQIQSNLKFLHLFTFFEIVILSHFFNIIFKQLRSKFKVSYIAIPTIIFVLINIISTQNFETFNTYSSTLVSIVIIAYCIHFFILILDQNQPDLKFTILKWFVICLFFNHCVSLIVMLFGSLFHNISRDAQSYIWSFRLAIIFITKVILTYHFIKLLLSSTKLDTP